MIREPKTLFIAWQDPEKRAIYPVARLLLRGEAPAYEFAYVRGVQDALKSGFVPFPQMEKLDTIYLAHEMFPLLTNRLMPKSREDYQEYIHSLGLCGDPAPML